ncbi:hypothetical protein I3760_04G135300 [Carya illinoinensis]|nr:hypothetical protein I3760_04G135300 [Carya illinoinensis]
MKLLSWNCRGLGNPRTVQDLCSMAESNKPQLVFIMETKIRKQKSERIKRRLACEGCFVVEAVGKGGGLMLLWDSNVDVEIINFSQRHINAWVGGDGGTRWFLTCFYGPPETVRRKEAWLMLKAMKPRGNEGWLIVGDFNVRPESQMELFREVLREGNLNDLGWRGISILGAIPILMIPSQRKG